MDNTSVTGCDTLVRRFFSVQTSGVHLTAHRPRGPLLFTHGCDIFVHIRGMQSHALSCNAVLTGATAGIHIDRKGATQVDVVRRDHMDRSACHPGSAWGGVTTA